jgi:hypothetical protein
MTTAQIDVTTTARAVEENAMRRLGFAVGAMSMAVAACGRIVTVPKNNSENGGTVPAGNMYIRFRTLGTLNFSQFYYVVVFNTSGNGQEPYAATFQSYTNYSFALVFGGTSLTGASYQLLQVISTGTSAGYTTRSIPITPLYVTNFNADSDGTGNEFTFTFNRLLLLTVPNPLASATPSPSPSPSATPTTSASPRPTPLATPSTSPGTSTLWAMNFFSTDTSFHPIDAIANNGINDVSFTYVVDTTKSYDVPVNKPIPPPVQVANTSAQVIAIEVINTP